MTRTKRYKRLRDLIFFENMNHIRDLNHYNPEVREMALILECLENNYEYKHKIS